MKPLAVKTSTCCSFQQQHGSSTLQHKLSTPVQPLRIAILLNSDHSPYISSLKHSYEKAILAASPSSSLTFYYPAHATNDLSLPSSPPSLFPDPTHFDLFILGGSNVDPRKRYPWILRVHSFIRTLVSEFPFKKLVGICWGHQTIALVFGGQVDDMDVPEFGVTSHDLTPEGISFFGVGSNSNNAGASQKKSSQAPSQQRTALSSGTIRIQQHHRREVCQPAVGFLPLVHDNQCYINTSNTILTFQGHPEKNSETALLRLHDAARWFSVDTSDLSIQTKLRERIELEHDGKFIWNRILEWAHENQRTTDVGRL